MISDRMRGASAFVTLDPATKYGNGVISGGGLILSLSANSICRATLGLKDEGKRVFEVTSGLVNVTGSLDSMFGISDVGDPYNLIPGYNGLNSISQRCTYANTMYYNSIAHIGTRSLIYKGAVVMFIVDTTTRKYTIKYNKPVDYTPDYPYSSPALTGNGLIYPKIRIGDYRAEIRVNFGATPFVNTMPSGCKSWDGSQIQL